MSETQNFDFDALMAEASEVDQPKQDALSNDALDIDLKENRQAVASSASTEAAVTDVRPEPRWQASWDADSGKGRDSKGHFTTIDKERDAAMSEYADRDGNTENVMTNADADQISAAASEPVFAAVPTRSAEPVFEAAPSHQSNSTEGSADNHTAEATGWRGAWNTLRNLTSRQRSAEPSAPTPTSIETNTTTMAAAAASETEQQAPAAPERLMVMTEAELVLAETQFNGLQADMTAYYAEFGARTTLGEIALLAQLTAELHAMQAGVEGLSDEQQADHRPQLEFFQQRLQTLMRTALAPDMVSLSDSGNYVEANRRMVDLLQEAMADREISDDEMQDIAQQMTLANIDLDSVPGRARMARERQQLRRGAVEWRSGRPIDREAHRQANGERMQRAVQAVIDAATATMTAATMTAERVGAVAQNTYDRTAAVADGVEAAAVNALNVGAERTDRAIQGVLALQAVPAEVHAVVVDLRQGLANTAHELVDTAQDTVARNVDAAAGQARGMFEGLRNFGRQFADALATIGPAFEATAATFRRRAEERGQTRNWDIAEANQRRDQQREQLLATASERRANPRGLSGLRARLANWASI